MPKNVGSPSQSDAASTAARHFDDVKSGRPGSMNRFNRTRPLSKFEREALNAPIESVYLYNISPIFKWQKDFRGLGTITLFPRRAEQEYSEPIVLAKRLVRTYDGGNRIQRLMVETPLEIVEDFLACSNDNPTRTENNLQSYGAFFVIGCAIEELDKPERQAILDEAELRHRTRLHEKVAGGDALANSPIRSLIGEVEKKAALYLHSVGELSDLPDWVARRAKLNTTDECPFCGFENKRGGAKCRNCSEILDFDLYEKLKKERQSKKAS